MIVVKLQGGLGNQMFQYALARHLSIKNNTVLFLDISELLPEKDPFLNTRRHFELDVFNIKYSIRKSKQVSGIFRKVKDYLFPPKNIVETGFSFNPNIFHTKGNIILDGYWQNQQYFKDIEDTIRKEFTFKSEPDEENKQFINQIKFTNAVSVHFRRGDYFTNAATNSFHGLCSKEYYLEAINYISKHIKALHYYIFSDDINWVKQNFHFGESHTYVDWNTGENSFEDMRLMSVCKHNIIANSSFSWWAAWLNSNKDKTVIAPETWFADLKKNKEAQTLIPEKWIRI